MKISQIEFLVVSFLILKVIQRVLFLNKNKTLLRTPHLTLYFPLVFSLNSVLLRFGGVLVHLLLAILVVNLVLGTIKDDSTSFLSFY